MDTSTSAAPDEKTPQTQLSNEKSKPSGPLEIGAERFSSVARLSSSSINELQGLVSELQKMQDFLKSEVDNVQRQIDSASSKLLGRGRALQAHKHYHPALAMAAQWDRPILTNAFAPDSNGPVTTTSTRRPVPKKVGFGADRRPIAVPHVIASAPVSRITATQHRAIPSPARGGPVASIRRLDLA